MKKRFSIKLLDGDYSLHYDNIALYRFEELHGDSVVMVMVNNRSSIRVISHFIWAGLLHEYPDISVSEVIKKVNTERLNEYVSVISEAVNNAFGDSPKQAKKKA